MPSLTVAVVFGGRSVEHEVSVLTGHQTLDALIAAGYKTLPIYIAKDGAWYAGFPLGNLDHFRVSDIRIEDLPAVYRVSLTPDRTTRQLVLHPYAKRGLFRRDPELWADVFLPCTHGTFGEDGTLQGVFEMADVPYAGCGVLAAALSMDKVQAKAICRAAGIPVLDEVSATRAEWNRDPQSFLRRVDALAPYPVIVKPCSLGSSIGVRRCASPRELQEAVETALVLDERVMVERALTQFQEVNCAVLGPPSEASVCEMPKYQGDLLSFDSKYRPGGKNGAKSGSGAKAMLGARPLVGAKGGISDRGMASFNRVIPAPIAPEQTAEIQRLAVAAFETIGAEGVARADFLLEADGRIYFNEINTVPGSLAYYLWEASGLKFPQLVTRLVDSALRRHESRRKTQFAMNANLLTSARA